MLTQAIKEKISELFDATPPNVSVGYGKKITNGQYTGELGILFYVEKKLPISEIPENEILPTSIIIDGIEHATDVIASGKFSPLICDSSCYTWENILTPPPNRNTIRPLQGGISMTTTKKLGYVGTLGLIVVDVATQALVGLTNNHVACGDHFYTSLRNYTDGQPTNELNSYAYQNGEGSISSEKIIGKVVRYIPLADTGNLVDGALISVNSSVISLTESFKQYGLNYNLPMAFASTAEINSILTTDPPIYSSGRTTGAKGSGPCQLTINSIGVTLDVGYENQNVRFPLKLATFENCIIFTRPDPTCRSPIAGGDSGSALIADFNGVWKIIGLVFAGGSSEDVNNPSIIYHYGVANRIDDVAVQLGIQAWDGTAKNYINDDSFQYKTTVGGSSNKTLTCSGSTYWQMGLTDSSLPC